MNVNRTLFPDLPNAACNGADPEEFFPGEGGRASDYDVSRAKGICGTCPEVMACLQWALEHKEQGIWGGTTDEERNKALRRRKVSAENTLSRDDRVREVTNLHAEGLTDSEIARRLKVSRQLIQADRSDLGLPDHYAARVAERRQAVAVLHARGYNDIEIARQLKVSRHGVLRARAALGLPPNLLAGQNRCADCRSLRWGISEMTNDLRRKTRAVERTPESQTARDELDVIQSLLRQAQDELDSHECTKVPA